MLSFLSWSIALREKEEVVVVIGDDTVEENVLEPSEDGDDIRDGVSDWSRWELRPFARAITAYWKRYYSQDMDYVYKFNF